MYCLPLSNHLMALLKQLHLLLPWYAIQYAIELVVQEVILIPTFGELVIIDYTIADAGHRPRLTER